MPHPFAVARASCPCAVMARMAMPPPFAVARASCPCAVMARMAMPPPFAVARASCPCAVMARMAMPHPFAVARASCPCLEFLHLHNAPSLKSQPSPPWGRGWIASGALISRGEKGAPRSACRGGEGVPIRASYRTPAVATTRRPRFSAQIIPSPPGRCRSRTAAPRCLFAVRWRVAKFVRFLGLCASPSQKTRGAIRTHGIHGFRRAHGG